MKSFAFALALLVGAAVALPHPARTPRNNAEGNLSFSGTDVSFTATDALDITAEQTIKIGGGAKQITVSATDTLSLSATNVVHIGATSDEVLIDSATAFVIPTDVDTQGSYSGVKCKYVGQLLHNVPGGSDYPEICLCSDFGGNLVYSCGQLSPVTNE